jgi:MinD-like ATPase involved in chromosome partitioning or flagellar assembly
MVAGKTIAFHSYKGGTGKTTLITNISALYAKNGFNVGLMDFDLYAPSLVSYFRKKPSLFLNDVLSGQASIFDVVMDLGPELDLKGKFVVGFSSQRKDDIDEIELRHDTKWQLNAVKRFLQAKKELFEKFNLDYLFLDTSPGIRYWSVNSLAMADFLFLLFKDSDMDIEGTRKMITEIYDALSRVGSKYYLVLNKVPGAVLGPNQTAPNQIWINELERVMGAEVVGTVPCFCDVQFCRHEFLFSVNSSGHNFSKSVTNLAEKIQSLL